MSDLPHILLCENNSMLADMYLAKLSRDYRISYAKNAQSAVDILDNDRVDVLLTDVMLGSHDGIELIHEVRSHGDWQDVKIVVLSSLPAEYFPIPQKQWSLYGINNFVYKPEVKPGQLTQIVNSAV